MINLGFANLENVNDLVYPTVDSEITEYSSALDVVTDFRKIRPLVIDANTPASVAESLMMKAHVKLKIVVDDKNHFLGTLSLDDINEQEILKKVNAGYKRSELIVSDFMKARSTIVAFKLKEIEQAKVKDIINALKDSSQQHFPILDDESNKICGLISSSDILRKLRLPVDLTRDSSFYSIYTKLHS